MYAYVLPIEAILFQVVLIAIAIAIEAEVFYDRFVLTRRQSLEYSILLNLLSSIASWIVFFLLQWLLPEAVRLELISYVFFDRLYRWGNALSIPSILMIFGILNFIFVIIVEFSGTFILQRLAPSTVLVSTVQIPKSQRPTQSKALKKGRVARRETFNVMTGLVMSDPNKVIALLTANTFSSGITFALLCLLGFVK